MLTPEPILDYYAHTYETSASGKLNKAYWQPLSAHLSNVAGKAQKFAGPLGFDHVARWTGLLHDLGKYSGAFQEYLAGERPGSVETHHAVYGAALAFNRKWLGPAFAIAGHHAGLHDLSDLQALVCGEKYDAMKRIQKFEKLFEIELGEIPNELAEPEFANPEKVETAITEFYVRMLFSCLVDADFIDTEHFSVGRERESIKLDASMLLKRLQSHRVKFDSSSELNKLRNRVFEDCLSMAAESVGFFSLTVPTGGGKTLSSMAFALEHARRNRMQRVIVVIPYLSIIEQNAAEYRKVLDPQNEGIVIEHHSAVTTMNDDWEQRRSSEELATENWDAPVIVTTSVQFIESLFANRPSKCRKLHNIANSVVLLDEVQTLPANLLNPLLHILRDLQKHYRTSFVFSTATQPAFVRGKSLSNGFDVNEVKEIASQTNELFQKLDRVVYEVRSTENDWSKLTQEWAGETQVLGVVNTRKHAAVWWELLRAHEEGVMHLSSAMCAEHRTEVLIEAQWRLKNGKPCWLVATQVIEAGVDIDFPLVYRALGPLDSIIQAAGRCNREGLLPNKGRVVVFRPSDAKLPSGTYRVATDISARLLSQISSDGLSIEPDLFHQYFGELFQYVPTDYNQSNECSIQEDREALRFREVARKAKVISDDTQAVIAPRQKALEMVTAIRERSLMNGPRFSRKDLRDLQRFMVNLHLHDFQQASNMGLLHPLLPGMELNVLDEAAYHEHLGVVIDRRPTEDFLL